MWFEFQVNDRSLLDLIFNVRRCFQFNYRKVPNYTTVLAESFRDTDDSSLFIAFDGSPLENWFKTILQTSQRANAKNMIFTCKFSNE